MNVSNRIICSGNNRESQYLNGVDTMFAGFSTHLFLFDHILSEANLIESLKKTLCLNPYFAGRIHNIKSAEPLVTACDSGLLFSVETYDEDIHSFYACDSSYLDRGYIKLNSGIFDEDTPLLQIKLSLYRNGSVLGVSFYHVVCDGISFFDFLNSWGKVARNEKPGTVEFNRQMIKKQAIGDGKYADKHTPVVKFDYNELPSRDKSSKGTFRLTSTVIENLLNDAKHNGAKDHAGLKYSLWQAYVAKLILSNLISDDNRLAITFVYNSRSLLGLGKRFFGNSVIYPFFQVEKNKFNNMSIESISEKILSLRDTLSNHPECLHKDSAFWDARLREGSVLQHHYTGCILSYEGGLYFNTSTKQPVYDIDFGSGAPVWYETPNREMAYRNIRAFPAPEKNGDIILYVTLPHAELIHLSKHFDPIATLAEG